LQFGTDASINQETNDFKPVVVTFKVLPSGKITDVKIVDSAGNELLASKVQSSIQNTPVDKFPEYIDEKDLDIKLSYYFF
jgi:TonB family protein